MVPMKRLLLWLAVILLTCLLVAAGAGVYVIRRPFPQATGTLRVPGLQAPVEVIRDRWGVPHLFAQNAHDLLMAQGYVHAQDRLWQMEYNRRAASGRLSEIFGEATVDTDRFLRTIGLRRAAQEELARLDAPSVDLLNAYAAGVNAFMTQRAGRLPVEFALLQFQPEPWTPVDTLAFGKLIAWMLGGDWATELLRAHLIARFGPDGMRALMPPYAPDAPIIAPEAAAAYRSLNSAAVLRLLDLASRIAPSGTAGLGSNNWVVAGSHTATGAPLLANDPHLEIAMPSIWYEMHLVGGGFNVTGATFAGVPGVIVGHNESIAWGVTNASPHVQDLYIEQFNPDDPSRYLFKGRWESVRVVREEIRVKGRARPEVETVRITRHGPLLNGVVKGLGVFLALRWTALEPGQIVASVLRLDRAQTWEEFRDALRLWTVPAQNFVYADRTGTIGYQLPGRIPIRAKGNGLVPVPGWTGEYEWVGEIPFDRLPSVRNPDRGFLVTANNRITPDGYPFFISADWDPGFRASRIEAVLRDTPWITPDTMAALQMDVTSLPGQVTVRALQDVRVTTEPAAALLKALQAWDGVLRPDSRAAAIYEAFRLAVLPLLFKDVLGPELFQQYRGRSDVWQVALLHLLQDPASPWWGFQGRDAVIAAALERAHEMLEKRLGPDAARWAWGGLHRTRFVHPLGHAPALGWIFNAQAPPLGGDAFTVNTAGFDPDTFEQIMVASYRQIIDLADWDRAVAIHTTGQSGLPFHPHYRDFVPLWAAGRYHPMLFSRGRIEQATSATLTLTP